MWYVSRLVGACFLSGFMFSGCTVLSPSEESHFYLLSSPGLDVASRDGAVNPATNIITSVGPVRFADYLKRSSVVIQNSDNQYEIAKLDQWGGSLENEFEMALLKNLMASLPGQTFVLDSGMLAQRSNYNLKIDVYRFDGQKGKNARLQASWAWVNESGVVASGVFADSVAAGTTVAEQVAAMSKLVARFAQSLSAKLHSDF
ncbi:MAG: hypothetical protein CSA50_08280 [Gammaproteobacteria bacterium]|nr:MAG: hypothetical protein CSA50_08280 [Gammaproteobacteria bacterium]